MGAPASDQPSEANSSVAAWTDRGDGVARSILLIGATPDWAANLAETLARPGDRIAIQYENDNEMEKGVSLAARIAARGAIALSLQENPSRESDSKVSIVARTIEDFARIDLAICFTRADETSIDATLRSWAMALEPTLKRARPGGRFLVVEHSEEMAGSASDAQDVIQTIAREWEAKRSRARVEFLVLQSSKSDAAKFGETIDGFRKDETPFIS